MSVPPGKIETVITINENGNKQSHEIVTLQMPMLGYTGFTRMGDSELDIVFTGTRQQMKGFLKKFAKKLEEAAS